VNLELDEGTLEFRDEVRAFLREHAPSPPLPSLDTPDGFAAHREWERVLADARLSVVSWPARLGGRDASLVDWVVFEEEYYAAHAPLRVSQNGIFLLAPTLFAHGTPEQLARILPPMARADEIWAQAWSEPEAGSDLAGIRSRAVPTDGGWLLSGQKTWSTRATYADKAFGLFRTDPSAERHRGLTYFLFDLRADGVTVRGIPQLDGEPGLPRSSSTTSSCPTPTCSGASATAGESRCRRHPTSGACRSARRAGSWPRPGGSSNWPRTATTPR
jgi:alkylation response protein AidB-like acyl-CoA dehydrogenase